MASITGLTAVRMLEIEGASIVGAEVVDDDLILEQHGGALINAGPVIGPEGPQGPIGPAGLASIPGEIRLWSGDVVPDLATYGRWVWADGAVRVVADHPLAAINIADEWRTFGGASDPGGANFRVPDLRGLVPSGMDAMPGGSRANRMTRAAAIIIANKSGKETHVITLAESAAHGHIVRAYGSQIGSNPTGQIVSDYAPGGGQSTVMANIIPNSYGGNPYAADPQGGNGAHENVQPTVFVPYIVYLDE